MKFCKVCNQQNSDTANFCIRCGASFEKIEKNQKNTRKLIISIIAIVAALLIAGIALIYTHMPASSIPKNKAIVMNYLEEKYPDDEFEIKSVEGIYGEYAIFEPIFQYTDDWECHVVSNRTGEEEFLVEISTDGRIYGDNYGLLKYKDEINDMFERSIDYYFGEGNSVFELILCDHYFDDSTTDIGAKKHIENGMLVGVIVFVSSDFRADDEAKICNDIEKNYASQFNISFDEIDDFWLKVYFDRADDIRIPNEYCDEYIGLNYWEKSLSCDIPVFDWEWEYNENANKEFKTKTPFLNGKVPVISIDGYAFTLGEATPEDIRKNTRFDRMAEYQNRSIVDPNQTDSLMLFTSDDYAYDISLDVRNNSIESMKLLNCGIYEITIGDWENYEMYSDCSFDGLFIGETVDEQTLIEHFGEYETITKSDWGSKYMFIDGTASAYDNIHTYPNKYLCVSLTNDNRIDTISYGFTGNAAD